jgi:hypothetical protein
VSDPTHQPGDPGGSSPAVARPARRRWQVGLRTLFLVTAIAVWMSYFLQRRQNATLEARIRALVPVAHELVVEDARRIAVVTPVEPWPDEIRWDLYLPDGRYRLCLATRGIDDEGLAPAVKSTPIASGRHQLALEQWQDKGVERIAVTCDGARLLSAEELRESSTHGREDSSPFLQSEQFLPDEPAVLYRRRYMRRVSKVLRVRSVGAAEGILLWIEPIAGSKPEP